MTTHERQESDQSERRAAGRKTVADKTVDVTRAVVSWPGRIGGWAVTAISWVGAWEIGGAALKSEPNDRWLLVAAILVFIFGTGFSMPERTVKTVKLVVGLWKFGSAKKDEAAP